MTDRELLELAAKACHVEVEGFSLHVDKGMRLVDADHNFVRFWNPLTDDGDALRLAVKLEIRAGVSEKYAVADYWRRPGMTELDAEVVTIADDAAAALRRAIVQAAAAIGETLQ